MKPLLPQHLSVTAPLWTKADLFLAPPEARSLRLNAKLCSQQLCQSITCLVRKTGTMYSTPQKHKSKLTPLMFQWCWAITSCSYHGLHEGWLAEMQKVHQMFRIQQQGPFEGFQCHRSGLPRLFKNNAKIETYSKDTSKARVKHNTSKRLFGSVCLL